MARSFPRQQPAPGRCSVPALQAELSALLAATGAGRDGRAARGEGEKVKELRRLLRRQAAVLPSLDDAALDEVLQAAAPGS